jgi:hypothetical protein
MIKRLLLFGLLFSQAVSAQQLAWPEITRENRPWSRWWWPGSIVTQNDLTWAMEKYKQAGLGGLELTVIYGVKGEEDRFINFLSPKWMDMFTWSLKEGERLDLGIDLANASGWPFGGPWVDSTDACKDINYKTWTLTEGQKLAEKIEFIQQPLIRAVGQRPDISKLIYPIGKNKDLQLYAIDQIRFEKPLPLYALVAYSDSGQVFDLTNMINEKNELEWIAPAGRWVLYGLFEGWHGKMVERAGPGGEGDVIDHFSGQAVSDYLAHFDEAFKGYDVRYLRGFFNDSYEVDDASGQSNWTSNLFYEFFIRRGYDLRECLPALFQKDTPEKNARVLSDYRQTISDLLLDKFTRNWTQWANRQGKTTRDQAHGSPGNILDMYAASDIPETEGYDITKIKFASSAGNVTGKKYVSCEAATWLGEHFTSRLSDVKRTVDLFLLGGVNHVFYHGTCFSPQNEPWPGFLFYAAVEFSPSNSFWNDFRGLNDYIAHIQSFMQKARPDNDILLYFPIFDRYADYGRGMLEHFDGISPAFRGTPFKTATDTMLKKGYAFDFISDLQLKNSDGDEEGLQTEGNIYKTLIIPGCKYIPLETFSQVLRLANNGAKVIFFDDLPENIAGWADLDAKTRAFDQMKAGIHFEQTNNPSVSRATFGKGKIYMGKDLEALLSFAGIRREAMADENIMFSRRESMTGYYYFIRNQGEKPFDGWLPLSVQAQSAAIFNPMTGNFGIAKNRKGKKGEYEIYTRLSPGETMIISTYKSKQQGNPYNFYNPSAPAEEISGKWTVTFTEGGPVIPARVETAKLTSWTDFGGDDVKNFSGTAVYSLTFAEPAGQADAYSIDLGKVCESARVKINGIEVAVLIGPDFRVTVDRKLLKRTNTLEVAVSNLMANRIAYLDRNKINWKKFYNVNFSARLRENNKNGLFDASAWQPMESGLIGPVTITPLSIMK